MGMPAKSMFRCSNLRKFLVLVCTVATVIGLILSTSAHSSRGRLNVMQVMASLFLLAVILRQVRAQTEETPIPDSDDGSLWKLLLALIAGAVIWAVMIPFDFINDDFAHLYTARQPLLQGIWEQTVRGQAGAFMRPVAFTSIFLDYRIWNHWPAGYHITNLLIHLVGVAGLYFVCRGLRLGTTTAAIASLIYAVLPINAEAIAWMGARFDLLSACLAIWTIALYLKFRQTDRRRFYIWSLLCFFFAAFSKENAYVVPLLLMSAECLVIPKRHLKPVFGFFVAAALFFGYRWAALGGIGGYRNPAGELAAYDVGFKTLEGLFIRVPAQTIFGFNWYQPPLAGLIILASLAASVLFVAALCARRGSVGWKRVLFCLSWIFLAVLPAHFLIFITPDLTHSHILYLGSAGAAILIAQLLSGIEFARTRWMATGILACLFGLAVIHNLGAWHHTSRLTQRFLTEIQELETSPIPNAAFVFHKMPRTVRGVLFLQAGLTEAIMISYGRDDLSARRAKDAFNGTANELHYVLAGNLEDEKAPKPLLTKIAR